jgi:hypothetical protein
MQVPVVFLLLISMAATAQNSHYCDQGPRTEKTIDGFDKRFCFGTKEYMEAFAKALNEQNIPHYVYKNRDIGYQSRYEEKVQEIGGWLLYKYIFTGDGKVRADP